MLVEANDDTSNGLFVAENTAASVAGYISNSWGGSESSTDTTLDSQFFNHPGDVITASAGDSDFGVIYPAASPNVVSVGGTSLNQASNSRGWTESVWNTTPGAEGTGSGCSAVEPRPSWQTALGLSGCSNRIDNDTAADADQNTGVAVYDTSNGNGGWNEVGGTSASSPMLAAMYALGGNPGRRHLHPHGQLLRRDQRQRRLVQPGLLVHRRDRLRRPDRHRHPERYRRPSQRHQHGQHRDGDQPR